MQESLGHRLRVMRAERGLSLREAARRAGVVKETISEIERGHTHPYDVTLAKLARAYGVPVEDLLEEPVPLAPAPPETGQPENVDAKEPLPEIPQSAETLKADVGRIKLLKGQHESDLGEISRGALDYDAVLRMEAVDKGVRAGLQERGVLAFAEAVRGGREFAQSEAIPLCHELLRELAALESLTAEARAVSAMLTSDIHEEAEEAAESWVRGRRTEGQAGQERP